MNLENLACPKCHLEIVYSKKKWTCSNCKESFSGLAELPNGQPAAGRFFKNQALEHQKASSSLAEWISKSDSQIEWLAQEVKNAPLRSTQIRLETLREGLIEQKKNVLGYLKSLGVSDFGYSPPVSEARESIREPGESLVNYEVNIVRDWCWGEAEIHNSLNLISSVLAPVKHASPRVLFLGSGAGRLGLEFAKNYPTHDVFLIEKNSLLTAIALERIFLKQPIARWVEFPLFPPNPNTSAVIQDLKESGGNSTPENIFLVWGDAFNAPFLPETFDVVISHWFTDVVPDGLSRVSNLSSVLLKKGGQWIQNGPLAWTGAAWSEQFTSDEVVEFVSKLHSDVFKFSQKQESSGPYLQSPFSHEKRTETEICLSFQKIRNLDNKQIPLSLQNAQKISTFSWIENPDQSIPLNLGFEQLQVEATIFQAVLGGVDGKASLRDLAKSFSAQFGISLEESLVTVTSFFEKSLRNARKRLSK